MKKLRMMWNALVTWFEHGDLVPLIVIISAAHYAAILRNHDHIVVAIAIGLLVDLGHYRWVRAAVRYSGADRRERFVRWALAAFMTAVAISYQQRFYGDWWLSLPLPALIASLAWLSHVDRSAAVRSPAPVVRVEAPQDAPSLAEPGPAAALPAPASVWRCAACGRVFGSQQGLAAHGRAHKSVSTETEATR